MITEYHAQLVSRSEVAPGIYYLQFKIEGSEEFTYKPGQYLLLDINGQYRQYSITFYNPSTRVFDLVVEYFKGGLASEYFLNLSIGQRALFKGPAGIFVMQPVVKPVVHLATGTGIAPLISMLDISLLQNTTHDHYLFWGAKTKSDLYLINPLLNWEKQHAHFHLAFCLSKETITLQHPFYSGRIQQHVDQILPVPLSECDVYVCGGKDAVEGLREFATLNGVKKQHLHFERFN